MLLFRKFLIIVVALFLVSCSTGNGGRMYVNEEADLGFYTRVGVIPLSNLTNERNASEKVTSSFVTELLMLETVEVANMGDFVRVVDAVMKRDMTDALQELHSEDTRIIGEQAQVQGVFIGEVKDYGMVRSGQTQFPLVSVIVRFVDCQTGVIVWSYETSQRGGPKFPIFSIGETYTLGAMTTKVCHDVAGSFAKIAK